jgi:outer membrane protein assembly factor BamB
MSNLLKTTLLAFSCLALTLVKPLPSPAFMPSDLDASNDAMASLAVPLKMMRFSLQDKLNASVSEGLPTGSEESISTLSTLSNLYVVNGLSATLSRYDSTSRTFLQTTSIGGGPQAATLGGANQDLFVSSISTTTQINRYDRNGVFLGAFATDQGGAALLSPGALKFGSSNGNLFVANAGELTSGGFVSQFDKDTGSFLGVFASNGSSFKPTGITFGSDSNLYVGDSATKSVLRFNGATGSLLGTFASDTSLLNPGDLAFGPNGNLFVGNATGNLVGNILQFNGTTGAFINVFTSGGGLGIPTSFAFGPDNNLYIADGLNDKILEFDGTTGAFIKNFATNSSSNDLIDPVGLVFGSAPVPEPAMGAGLPSLLLMGAYIKSKKYKGRNQKRAKQ